MLDSGDGYTYDIGSREDKLGTQSLVRECRCSMMPALPCRTYFFYEKAMSVAYVRSMLNEDLGVHSSCRDMYGYQVRATETWLKTTTSTISRQQEYVATSQSIACYILQASKPPLCRLGWPDSGCSLERRSMAAAPAIMASTWASNLRHCIPPTYANPLHAVHLLTSHCNARSALHIRLISPAGVRKAGRHLAHSCTTSNPQHDLSRHVCSATRSHKTLNCLITEICKRG